jgi:hypothetical protein
MIELYVENSKVDINTQFSTMLTMCIDDVKDFDAKHTTFSKTIIVAGTKNNNALFGNIFDVSGSNNYDATAANKGVNFNAAIGAKAYIFQDNIQVFKGTFRILEVIIDDGFIEYECSVFGELGGFVAKMAALKLEDLDFSAYNHTYSIANIIASRSNLGSSYIYANNIDYGTYSAGKQDWQYRTMRPALFIAEYVSKIMENAGYSYDCSLFSTDRFKGLIVPHNRKTLQRKSPYQLDVFVDAPLNKVIDSTHNNLLVQFDILTLLGNFTNNVNNDVFTYGSASRSGILNLKCKINYNNTSNSDVYIYLRVNGSILSTYTIYAVTSATGAALSLQSSTITINSGDYVDVIISRATTITSGSCSVSFRDVSELFLSNTNDIYVDLNLGEDITINDTLPKNILQKDFISSIVKLFNLYIFEDSGKDNHLNIMPFIDFYANATSIDWSLKIDRSQPIRIKPMSELNARYYDFKFKSDADYYNDLYAKRYNQTYGSYKYDSQYEFAKDSTSIELIFSGTPLVGYVGVDKVYSTIFKQTNGVEETIDSNIRILQTKLITGVSSWSIKDGSTVLGTYTDYLYAGHLDDPDAPANDIQFGVPKELFFTLVTGALNVNQFNVYWSSYMAEITDKDSKLLMAKVKLNYKDIYNLDFSKLIWVDGSLFRLNKIIDYNATNEDVCSVELIKVVNKIY